MKRKTPIFTRLPIVNVRPQDMAHVNLWRAFLDEMLFGTFGARPDEDCIDWLYERSSDWDPDLEMVADLSALKPEWIRMVRDKLENGEMPQL